MIYSTLATQRAICTGPAMAVNASVRVAAVRNLNPIAFLGATRDKGGVFVGTAWSPPV